MHAAELERDDDPDIAHALVRDPDCKCDRCESMRAGEPITLEMFGQCDECGGRAKCPPLCLACTCDVLERLADLASRSVRECGRSTLFGTDLCTLLKLRKAQLPEGSARLGFWRHARPWGRR